MKFKEMVVNFKVVKDTAFISKAFNKDRTGWNFKVSRYLSGAFAYGDRSGHKIEIDNGKDYIMPKMYDTRYDGISTDDDEWVKFWKKFIEDEWMLELEAQEIITDIKEYEE